MSFKFKTLNERLEEMNSDYKNKEIFNKLSESSQIVIINKIDELEAKEIIKK